jgi:hypothetical protein
MIYVQFSLHSEFYGELLFVELIYGLFYICIANESPKQASISKRLVRHFLNPIWGFLIKILCAFLILPHICCISRQSNPLDWI